MNISEILTVEELLDMEAAAKVFQDMCRKARLKLQPVSTGSSKNNKGLSDKDRTKILRRRKALLIKK